jgi:hypothetical protein
VGVELPSVSGHLDGMELVVKPALKREKCRFFCFIRVTTMVNDNTIAELKCRGHGKPRSFLPGIAEEGP